MSRVEGGNFVFNGDEFFLLATKETVKGVTKAAIYTQGVAKEMIGRGGGSPHRPSLPGQPPRRDTGILASSVSFLVVQKGLSVNGFVGPDIGKIRSRRRGVDPDYGFFLERGTRNMAERPWLRPSLIKASPRNLRFIRDALR